MTTPALNIYLIPSPSGKAFVYHPDDPVFVQLRSAAERPTGYATILSTADPVTGRYKVHYPSNDTTCHVNPARLHRVYPTDEKSITATVLICGDTTNYRRLARSQVRSHHRVVEIGSSYGVCTDILAQHSSPELVLGIEISLGLVKEARKRYPHLSFECLDALHHRERVAFLAKDADIVFMDVGGNRCLDIVIQVLDFVVTCIKPRLVVVKSEELYETGIALAHTPTEPVAEDGLIRDGSSWIADLVESQAATEEVASTTTKPLNPLSYPLRLTHAGIPICRLHNYPHLTQDGVGCSKTDICRYDHVHCHRCYKVGHRAVDCGGDQRGGGTN
ncbi:hypothetical protein HDU85_003229 [Gaertneriomyces sp. JEL0708]|nr:hypothetical protein HDU85_003229 [Gaertneriomyces sp. JEL0708]